MIKTIAYTNARPHTVPRGTQCRTGPNLFSAHCLMRVQSPWRSTSQRSQSPAFGSSPSGTTTQTAAWPPSGAHETGASGPLSRLRSTPEMPSLGSATRVDTTAKSPGTATQIPNNTSAISSTLERRSHCEDTEVRGSTPGSRIHSCTLSSVGRAPDPHTLSGGCPEVGVFESSRVPFAGEAQTEEGLDPLAGAAGYNLEGRVVRIPPPAYLAEELGVEGKKDDERECYQSSTEASWQIGEMVLIQGCTPGVNQPCAEGSLAVEHRIDNPKVAGSTPASAIGIGACRSVNRRRSRPFGGVLNGSTTWF